ncbi:MAG: IS4/Tn5 family transposase DNA-binding protein [Ktedonobacteraceae bacterium]
MKTQEVLDPQRWAERTFGSTRLKDMRRTRRAVSAATQMARDASASLPHQMQTWKDVKALYRLLDEPDVTFEALMQPHFQQTRACLPAEGVVLLIQDTTELDLSHRTKMIGIGQIGNAKGRGMLLQTVLAIVPESRTVLGCMAQKPFIRVPTPTKEQRYQRRHREHRETDVWMQMVEHVGSPPTTGLLVHVGDRGADMFPFFRACLSHAMRNELLTASEPG